MRYRFLDRCRAIWRGPLRSTGSCRTRQPVSRSRQAQSHDECHRSSLTEASSWSALHPSYCACLQLLTSAGESSDSASSLDQSPGRGSDVLGNSAERSRHGRPPGLRESTTPGAMRPIDAFREMWGISLKITSFDGSFADFDQELGVVICRYCVGTLDRNATTIRHNTQLVAMSMKLSDIANVNACCLTCSPSSSAARLAAASPGELGERAAWNPISR